MKKHNPPDEAGFISVLLQRSVFDMTIGMLAMTVCGNLYSCFDYLSSKVIKNGAPQKFLLKGHASLVQIQVILCVVFGLGLSSVLYYFFVLERFK